MNGQTNEQVEGWMTDKWRDGWTHSCQELKAPCKQTFDQLGAVLTKGIGI